MAELHKYSGAGNDFVVLDGRTEDVSAFRTPERIAALCAQHGTDGLMILTEGGEGLDFRMEYYNSDGSGGMMCGNGGRCIVAFADALGITPGDGRVYRFAAADGLHTGEILSREGGRRTVRLRMIDVREFRPALDGWFLDTGTRHFVRFVPDVEAVDIEEEGRRARWDPVFAPVGANANFVSVDAGGVLHVRTFEKGVEGETLACGTGITASAIAAYLVGAAAVSPLSGPASLTPDPVRVNGSETALPHPTEPSFAGHTGESPVHFDIQARIARLAVDFVPGEGCFTDVYLTGPAEELVL
jgi:diaminopimelate epimerase